MAQHPEIISAPHEELASIIAEMDIKQSKDFGVALIHSGIHAVYGTIIVITTLANEGAWLVV